MQFQCKKEEFLEFWKEKMCSRDKHLFTENMAMGEKQSLHVCDACKKAFFKFKKKGS